MSLCLAVSSNCIDSKVPLIIGSAIGIGRYWVSVALSVIVFSFVLYRLCHLEHVTFANKVLCGYVIAVFAAPLVCSGSAAHGITRKKDVTSMGLLCCQRGPLLLSVPGLQQEGIHVAVGIA